MGELLRDLGAWLTSGDQWSGADGIAGRLAEHLEYSLLATAVAVVIALPVGLLIGHTGRGAFLAVNLASFGRALPTVGLVVLVFLAGGLSMTPVYVALVALAVPAVVTNTWAGISAVDPEVRDAARGQGMRAHQVLLRVEIPLALPLIMTGVRLALIQVVATATIAAHVSFGGLGRYVFDGLAQRDLVQVLGGAVLVAALAIALDLVLACVQRLLSPPRARNHHPGTHPSGTHPAPTHPAPTHRAPTHRAPTHRQETS
ncbi:ABC transporter permease [Streptomyces sp. NPDC001889]